MYFTPNRLIFLAGLAQIALVLGSFPIPKILNWKPELAKVNVLIKQMFYTYAAYILVINLCFGLLSVFYCDELTDGSALARLVNGFIAFYWLSRIGVQFLYFDRNSFPTGKWSKLGEMVLVLLFTFLIAVYSWAFYITYL
jgi:UDP-N-acetylmuramyl pentapeptide phosphotransferase/UDP-N-acetylglucosamine-1-phosphate transferase